LKAGHILMLNPNVPHDVRAIEASAMLLTVHRV
jgi:quercetin dioxygenase-like cupin family protein